MITDKHESYYDLPLDPEVCVFEEPDLDARPGLEELVDQELKRVSELVKYNGPDHELLELARLILLH